MHNAQTIAANLFAVTKKRSNKPPLIGFGERLEQLRGGASREIVSRKLEKLGAPIGGSTLAQYEKGAVWAPDAAVLWGLAQIYGVEHDELVALLRESRRQPALTYVELRDLLRHEGDQRSDLSGRSDVPASAAQARVQSVNPTIIAALENVAALVTQAITEAKGQSVRDEDARVRKTKPRVRRRAGGHR